MKYISFAPFSTQECYYHDFSFVPEDEHHPDIIYLASLYNGFGIEYSNTTFFTDKNGFVLMEVPKFDGLYLKVEYLDNPHILNLSDLNRTCFNFVNSVYLFNNDSVKDKKRYHGKTINLGR